MASPAQTQSRAQNQPARWRVRLLGRVHADGAALSVARWHSRAVAELLARLALEPERQHPREELAELLWPGCDGGVGRSRLRQALSILRSQLHAGTDGGAPTLMADRQSVWLAPDAVETDVARFEALVRAGDWPSARQLYAGELMPGHYSDWVQVERQRLASLRERCDGLDADRPADHPTAPARSQPPAAEASLADPTAPAPAATRRTARTGRPTSLVRSDGPQLDLPSYWTPVFGLEPAAAAVNAALDGHRLVTIAGPGGMGKTRLAVESLRERAGADGGQGLDLVQFASAAHARTAEQFWLALADRLPLAAPGPARDRVMARYSRLRALLLLDNAEQLEPEAVEAVAALLQASPALRLLVTSRRRLGLEGECVIDLRGLPGPRSNPTDHAAHSAADPSTAEAALQSPAVLLFADRARASRADFHLTPHNQGSVVALVSLLEGMPLAIELAASRVRALQPRELFKRLSAGHGTPMLDLLARPGATPRGTVRHASMRSVIAWSWSQLSPDAQLLLRGLSVLSLPCTVRTAEAIWHGLQRPNTTDPLTESGAGDLRQGQALAQDGDSDALVAALAEAVDASMLEPVRGAGDNPPPMRYRMLQPVHEYAAEMTTDGQASALRRHLRRWLARLGEQRLPRDLSTLQDDVVHMGALLVPGQLDGDPALVAAMLLGARSALHARVPVSQALMASMAEAAEALEQQLQARAAMASEAECDRLSRIHAMVAQASMDMGRFDDAALRVQQADHWARGPIARAMALAAQAHHGLFAGDGPDQLLSPLDEAVQLARAAGDWACLAVALRLKAMVLVNRLEDYARAEPIAIELCEIGRQQGDAWAVRGRMIDLAACWGWMNRQAEALALLQTCIAECEQHPPTYTLMTAQWQLGRLALNTRDWPLAWAALTRFAQLCKGAGVRRLLASGLAHLGEAWLMLGHTEAGARMLGFGTADLARWAIGNRIQSREIRRARRMLVHRVGVHRARHLLAEGQAMAEDEALDLVRHMAQQPLPATAKPT